MSEVVLKVENLSKQYRLGEIGTGTISHDLNRWWSKIRGKEDPYSRIGQVNDRTKKAESEYVNVLNNINFEVNQGDVLGVIGKNGAGKSTLLKLISRITSPSAGSIKAKGRIASLLEVGTGMHPEMTARENIFLNGSILGMTKNEIHSKFDEIIDFAGCALYVDTPVKRFSSGMRVRLGFAVAAFLEPEILIVDEVLAVGDAEFQKKAIGKMKSVSTTEGRTVLFVSHNLASVQSLCNKILVLDKGKVVFLGDLEEGIKTYLNLSSSGSELKGNKKSKHGLFEIIDFYLSDFQGGKTINAVSGQELKFNIKFNSSENLSRVIIRLTITDVYGNVLFILNNHHTCGEFSLLRDNFAFCQLKKLPLLPGSYGIDLQVLINKEEFFNETAFLSFDVVEGDFFNSGKIPAINKGMLVEHSWSNG